ncbi:MAG: glycosyltransferase family 4 protein [Acidimicrobiales bacterium]
MPSPPHTGDDAAGRPLAVALDATALLGRPTGVGAFCAGALRGLDRRPELSVRAFAVSWRRRRGIEALVPAGVSTAQRAMAARPLRVAWAHTEVPPVEAFVGPLDVVHGTNFVVPPARRAARVATVHDLTTVRYPELCDRPTLAYPALIRRALRHGAWVHTPSAFVAAEVVEHFGADPERVRAVHSGVPELPTGSAERDREVTARLLPPGTERYVLAVGTAEPRKDLPGLVRAFDELGASRPGVTLVLAGPEGWGSDELDSAIGRSACAARVVRTGWLDDGELSSLLRQAALLAYPSRYEGFGFPPLQAMAAGVPVVATTAGALPEVLDDAAELVGPGDHEALAGALARVLDSAPVRDGLVARGRLRAAGFTWDRCAEGLAAVYRDARADRGAR